MWEALWVCECESQGQAKLLCNWIQPRGACTTNIAKLFSLDWGQNLGGVTWRWSQRESVKNSCSILVNWMTSHIYGEPWILTFWFKKKLIFESKTSFCGWQEVAWLWYIQYATISFQPIPSLYKPANLKMQNCFVGFEIMIDFYSFIEFESVVYIKGYIGESTSKWSDKFLHQHFLLLSQGVKIRPNWEWEPYARTHL